MELMRKTGSVCQRGPRFLSRRGARPGRRHCLGGEARRVGGEMMRSVIILSSYRIIQNRDKFPMGMERNMT